MSIGLIVVLVILGLVVLVGVIFGVWVWVQYNAFVRLRNNVDESYSTMDVYMKKRYDLIPNLVETVKGYAKHEKEALEEVMKARYSCMTADAPAEKAKNENWLAGTLKSLFAVAENYPDLKANQNFMELSNSLRNIENEIANSRKYYNGSVKVYNNLLETFPSNIVGKYYKFEEKVMFAIENAEERIAPKVSF